MNGRESREVFPYPVVFRKSYFAASGPEKLRNCRKRKGAGACFHSERRITMSNHDDAAIVAALDTEYQAAVERNDAATMDRILADDFVLIGGKGKVYTKEDLLAEARRGN